jgi:hypothetical protein
MYMISGMRIVSKKQAPLALGAKLRTTCEVTSELMAEILNVSRRRALVPGHRAKALQLEQLIDAGAWIDAALALLELELPLWHIRRIAYDDGEWYCALSRQRELPDWLDESLEARHPDLALAILSAFIEAQAAAASFGATSLPASSAWPDSDPIRLCCDNFA